MDYFTPLKVGCKSRKEVKFPPTYDHDRERITIPAGHSIVENKMLVGGWFQPIWKIWASQMGSFPPKVRDETKKKHAWNNHQLPRKATGKTPGFRGWQIWATNETSSPGLIGFHPSPLLMAFLGRKRVTLGGGVGPWHWLIVEYY